MNYPSEVQEALDKAVKKYGPNLEGAMPTKSKNRTVKAIGWPQYAAAFKSGQRAKRLGFDRVTPYYECAPMDHFWLAGYDGHNMELALSGFQQVSLR